MILLVVGGLETGTATVDHPVFVKTTPWTIAEPAGAASPHGMQHLLTRSVWDTDKVRDDVRGDVVDHLSTQKRC